MGLKSSYEVANAEMGKDGGGGNKCGRAPKTGEKSNAPGGKLEVALTPPFFGQGSHCHKKVEADEGEAVLINVGGNKNYQ